MRSVTATRDVPVPPEMAWERLAAFESCAEWDPGVESATRVTAGAPNVGTRFDVRARFLGQTVPMDYEIIVADRPHRLGLVGRSARSRATDTIVLTPIPGGTRVRWTLDLQLLGLSRFAEPLLGPVLRRLAQSALDGLQQDLSQAR